RAGPLAFRGDDHARGSAGLRHTRVAAGPDTALARLVTPPAAPRLRCGIHSADPHCRPMPTIRPFREGNVALVIAPREIAAIPARRLSRSGERTLHRRIEAFDTSAWRRVESSYAPYRCRTKVRSSGVVISAAA